MNPAEARVVDSSRYPPHLSEAGFVQPCPRRIRARRDGAIVLDTLSAFYVWEVPYYPAYYVPVEDVDPALLAAASRPRPSTSGPFAGLVHVDWDAVDAWFEEDEEVFGGHPRSPYARVDAIRSSRHIRVELDGVVLAESASPVMLFETGLPTAPLHPAHRRLLRPPRAHRHRHLLPVQGDDQRLLVGAGRRQGAPRHRLVLRLPDRRGGADRRAGRLLRREGRHLPRRRPGRPVPGPNSTERSP